MCFFYPYPCHPLLKKTYISMTCQSVYRKKNSGKKSFFTQMGKCFHSSQNSSLLTGQIAHKVKTSREPRVWVNKGNVWKTAISWHGLFAYSAMLFLLCNCTDFQQNCKGFHELLHHFMPGQVLVLFCHIRWTWPTASNFITISVEWSVGYKIRTIKFEIRSEKWNFWVILSCLMGCRWFPK